LPEDEQTSKYGGGGRYNAILEFKGEQKKRKKMSIKKNEKNYMYEKKRKNMSMCKNKIK
jgi:hypothetical protein